MMEYVTSARSHCFLTCWQQTRHAVGPRAVQFTIKNMQFKKSEGKRQFVRHEFRQEDNIKIDPKGIANEVWIEFIWLRIRTSSGFL